MKVILLWGTCVAAALNLCAQVPTLGNVFLTANTDSLAQTLSHKTGTAKLSTLLSLCKSLDLWETNESNLETYIHQRGIKNLFTIQGPLLLFFCQAKSFTK